MSDKEKQARETVAKADAKLKSWSASFFGNKYEDAEEIYKVAANQFKAAKCCTLPPAACRVTSRSGSYRTHCLRREGSGRDL